MPYVITEPETKTITQTLRINNNFVDVAATRTVDHVSIDDFNVHMPLNNPAGIAIEVWWSLCYLDGTVLFPVQQEHTRLDVPTAGQPLLDAMNAPVPPGMSVYGATKVALYNLLEALGKIPAGDIV